MKSAIESFEKKAGPLRQGWSRHVDVIPGGAQLTYIEPGDHSGRELDMMAFTFTLGGNGEPEIRAWTQEEIERAIAAGKLVRPSSAPAEKTAQPNESSIYHDRNRGLLHPSTAKPGEVEQAKVDAEVGQFKFDRLLDAAEERAVARFMRFNPDAAFKIAPIVPPQAWVDHYSEASERLSKAKAILVEQLARAVDSRLAELKAMQDHAGELAKVIDIARKELDAEKAERRAAEDSLARFKLVAQTAEKRCDSLAVNAKEWRENWTDAVGAQRRLKRRLDLQIMRARRAEALLKKQKVKPKKKVVA